MGVPKFFRWLSERYPKVNQRLGRVPNEDTIREHFGNNNNSGGDGGGDGDAASSFAPPDPLSECSTVPPIDRLYIDMNGIIHGCSHNNATAAHRKADAEDDSETVSRISSETEIFRNCCYYLDRVVRDIVQPKQLVYLAVDGVAPRAKLNQQRSRRYRSGKEGEIERTVYDAHLKKIMQERRAAAAEGEEEMYGDDVDENGGILEERASLGTGDFLMEDEGLNYGSNYDGTLAKKDAVVREDDAIQEIEPGRFAGKFEARLDDDENAEDSANAEFNKIFKDDNTTSEKQGEDDDDDDDDDDNLFHSNQITPGTPFFARCAAHLEHFLRRKVSEDPAWQKLTVVFSGSHVPGEGEHKIMQFLREQRAAYEVQQEKGDTGSSVDNDNNNPLAYHPNLRHCIMGQDGDLIMLGLLSHEPNLVLLREQVLFDVRRRQQQPTQGIASYIHNANFELLHMNVLRDYFAYEFETSNVLPRTSPWDLEACIDDFVFLTFFVGNDFLPHMPALDIADEAFDLLFYTYREVRTRWLKESKKSKKKPYLTDAGTIVCGKRLEDFLQVLGKHETPYMEYKKQTDDQEKNREWEARYGQSTTPSDEVIAAKEASDRAVFRERVNAMLKEAAASSHSAGTESDSDDDDQMAEVYADFQPVLTTLEQPSSTTRPKRMRGNQDEDDEDAAAMQARMGGLLRHTLGTAAGGKGGVQIDDQDLKGRYYSDKFGFGPFDVEKHVALRKAYLKGLVWNLKYYYEGCASWEWYYPYHYGPMLSDLRNIEGLLQEIEFEMGQPLKPFEQLMACMPPSHAEVLPEPYRPLMTSDDSPIADFYPRSFTIDMNGKRWPWEAVVLLPFIDSERLLRAAASIDESQLTDEEQQRNELGAATVYSHEASAARRLEAVGEGAIFGPVEECTAKGTPLESTPLHYTNTNVKPLFRPRLLKDVETPLPGFPTLRDGSVQGLWRKSLKVNIHGSASRYKTACLELKNPLPEVLPIETIAQHLNGTVIWINYPHLIEALVTAVSDSEGFIRGEAPRQLWNREEAEARKKRVPLIFDDYVFGEKLVGTGGLSLVGGEETTGDLEVLLYVRPFRGLKTMPDGTVVKTFASFEVEVPLFVTAWVPQRMDERLMNLPVRLEKDPFNVAKQVITDKHPKPSPERRAPVSISRKFGRFSSLRRRMLQSSRGFHTFACENHPTKCAVSSSLSHDWRFVLAGTMNNHLRSRGLIVTSSCESQLHVGSSVQRDFVPCPSVQSGRVMKREKVQSVPRSSFRSTARRHRGGILAIGLLTAVSFLTGVEARDFTGALKSSPARFRKSFMTENCSEKSNAGYDSPPFGPKRPTPPIELAHGTTTLSFSFEGGIVAAVDSRASMGSFVGSKTTQKVLPINSHVLGTMAGGAADCMYWIRKVRCEAQLYELNEGRRMPVAQCSRMLSNWLYEFRGLELSCGTIVMGFDDKRGAFPKIFYVDNTGMRIEGDMFSVGSGSTLALGILDSEHRHDMTVEEAVALGIKAIRHATFRDAYSGGFINVYLITRDGWKRVFTEDLDRLVAFKDEEDS